MPPSPTRWACLLLLLHPSLLAAREFSVQPYGCIQFNAIYGGSELRRFAGRTEVRESHGNRLRLTSNQSTVGLRIRAKDELFGARIEARIEFDFLDLDASASGHGTAPAPELRLAHARLVWDGEEIAFGKDWVRTFAPLNPRSVGFASVPMLAASGNLWSRAPQFRLTRTRQREPSTGSSAAVALSLSPEGQDDWISRETGFSHRNGILPFVEARLGMRRAGKAMEHSLGLAFHYGEERPHLLPRILESQALSGQIPAGSQRANAPGLFFPLYDGAEPPPDADPDGRPRLVYNVAGNQRITSFGIAVDATFTAGDVAGMGELYYGRNLSLFESNSAYRVVYTVEDRAGVRTVLVDHYIEQKALGGWFQLSWNPRKRVRLFAGYGLDDPDDETVEGRDPVPVTRSQTVFGNLILQLSDHLQFGTDVGLRRISYLVMGDDLRATGRAAREDRILWNVALRIALP